MAGSFGSTIGFVFSFIMSISLLVLVFNEYEKQIRIQDEMIEDSSNIIFDLNFFENYFFQSNRVSIFFENREDFSLNFENCFEYVYDNKYMSRENFMLYPNEILGSYYSTIEKNDVGRAFFFVDNTFSLIKLLGCYNTQKVFDIQNYNWYNLEYDKRFFFEEKESNNRYGVSKTYTFDENDINLTYARENEIELYNDISSYLSLDLTFDKYSQQLEDYSFNSYDVYLGDDINTQSNEPTQKNFGVILNSYDFSDNSYINVLDFEFDALPKTFSFWFKTNKTLDSTSSNFVLFEFDSDNRISFNELGGGKIGFFSDSNIGFEIRSDKDNWEENKWYSVIIVLDNLYSKIYVNGILENEEFDSLDFDNSNDLKIGVLK